MLKFDERLYEILLVCNNEGVIKKVLYNSLKFDVFPIVGQSIINLSEETSKANLLNCLYTAINFNQSNKCEVNFMIGKKIYLMSVNSKVIDYSNILVGMTSTLNNINMYEDMMKMNNESINQLRKLVKEKSNTDKIKFISSDDSQDKVNILNGLRMSNYLEIIQGNYSEFIDLLQNNINIANYFAKYKNVKVELVSKKFISFINYENNLINEVLNCLLSIIVKYARCNSNILVSINPSEEFVILDIEFRMGDCIEMILKDEGYLFSQDIIDYNQGMMWYEENDSSFKFYILCKV